MLEDIRGYETFTAIEPIREGLSADQKYHVWAADGAEYLLRISDIAERERKQAVFDQMKAVAGRGVPMSVPLDFGVCNGGKSIYHLLSWCPGRNLEAVLPSMPEHEQYQLGWQAGEILRAIHSVPAPDGLEDWSLRYCAQNDDRIASFAGCGVQFDERETLLRCYADGKHLLRGRPQCFHHGDYHTGNLMLSDQRTLSVIDWEPVDYQNFGDPWEEFNRIGNTAVVPHFATGLLRGYFGGEPPEAFWFLLRFYLSAGAAMMISWAFYLQPGELAFAHQNARDVLRRFHGAVAPIPDWYLGEVR